VNTLALLVHSRKLADENDPKSSCSRWLHKDQMTLDILLGKNVRCKSDELGNAKYLVAARSSPSYQKATVTSVTGRFSNCHLQERHYLRLSEQYDRMTAWPNNNTGY
jgi:hypothetical protein